MRPTNAFLSTSSSVGLRPVAGQAKGRKENGGHMNSARLDWVPSHLRVTNPHSSPLSGRVNKHAVLNLEAEIVRRRHPMRPTLAAFDQTYTSDAGSQNGRVHSIKRISTAKAAVLTPMPRSSMAITATQNALARRSERNENHQSHQISSIPTNARSARARTLICSTPPNARRAAFHASSAESPHDILLLQNIKMHLPHPSHFAFEPGILPERTELGPEFHVD